MVYAPALGKLYAATADTPATCNGGGYRGHRSAPTWPARAWPGRRTSSGPIAARGGLTFVEKVPSLACRFAFLAEGLFDVAIASSNAHDWDMAAADLILEQAGGVMTNGDGTKLAYNRAVPRHRPLVRQRHAPSPAGARAARAIAPLSGAPLVGRLVACRPGLP